MTSLANARIDTIRKPREDWSVVPNLVDYAPARAEFRWEEAMRRELDGLPGRDGARDAEEPRWRPRGAAARGTRRQFVPLFWFALAGSAAFPPVPVWVPSLLLGLELFLSTAWLVLHATMGRRLPACHNAMGRSAGWTLFGLLLWIAADLPAAGVAPIAAAALVFSTLSAVGYLRDWVEDVATPAGGGRA